MYYHSAHFFFTQTNLQINWSSQLWRLFCNSYSLTARLKHVFHFFFIALIFFLIRIGWRNHLTLAKWPINVLVRLYFKQSLEQTWPFKFGRESNKIIRFNKEKYVLEHTFNIWGCWICRWLISLKIKWVLLYIW